jgi:tryptophan-rich sensory protein
MKVNTLLILYSIVILIIMSVIISTPFVMGCKVGESSGEKVKFRPPASAFGIAWGILYTCIALSWLFAIYLPNDIKANRKLHSILVVSFFYILLNALLSMWIVFYSCQKDKINSIYILVGSIVASLFCFTVGNTTSRLFISPLIGWLLLATLLNVEEVNQMKTEEVVSTTSPAQ